MSRRNVYKPERGRWWTWEEKCEGVLEYTLMEDPLNAITLRYRDHGIFYYSSEVTLLNLPFLSRQPREHLKTASV
jgi:hypothetical protein